MIYQVIAKRFHLIMMLNIKNELKCRERDDLVEAEDYEHMSEKKHLHPRERNRDGRPGN